MPPPVLLPSKSAALGAAPSPSATSLVQALREYPELGQTLRERRFACSEGGARLKSMNGESGGGGELVGGLVESRVDQGWEEL